MHEVLVNRLGGLSLPRKSVVRLTDRPDMTLDVYRGRKTTMQQQQPFRTYRRKRMPMNNLAIAGNFFLFIEVVERFQVVYGTFWIELYLVYHRTFGKYS